MMDKTFRSLTILELDKLRLLSIAGDLHNPDSEIARIVSREPMRTRKPEQGTGPNIYYLGAEESAINPEIAVEELPHMTMWSTLLKRGYDAQSEISSSKSLRSTKVKISQRSSSRTATSQHISTEAHIVYDTPKNTAPWGWKVSAYLGTKSIGTGVMVVAAFVLAQCGLNGTLSNAIVIILLGAMLLHVFLIMIEVFGSHSNSHVATAAHFIRSGRLQGIFWGVFFALGSLLPVAMLCMALVVPDAQHPLLAFAGILALIGIFAYEHCFVKAGQTVPLS